MPVERPDGGGRTVLTLGRHHRQVRRERIVVAAETHHESARSGRTTTHSAVVEAFSS